VAYLHIENTTWEGIYLWFRSQSVDPHPGRG